MMEAIDPPPRGQPAAVPAGGGCAGGLAEGLRPGVLPPYDEALLRRELELFPDWYL
jgi:hypothetical protein